MKVWSLKSENPSVFGILTSLMSTNFEGNLRPADSAIMWMSSFSHVDGKQIPRKMVRGWNINNHQHIVLEEIYDEWCLTDGVVVSSVSMTLTTPKRGRNGGFSWLSLAPPAVWPLMNDSPVLVLSFRAIFRSSSDWWMRRQSVIDPVQ